MWSRIQAYINERYTGHTPVQMITKTLWALCIIYGSSRVFWSIYIYGLKRTIVAAVYTLTSRTPLLQNTLKSQQDAAIKQLETSLLSKEDCKSQQYITLPIKGETQQALLQRMTEWSATERAKWCHGQVSGGIYHGGDELVAFLNQAYGLFSISNPLHPDVFPFVRKMEAEVVSMCINLFHGVVGQTCGTMTTGGTESILLACKSYRDQARALKGITEPEIIAPVTIHAAFDKAAHYFNIKLVHVPVDENYVIDLKALERAINRNTIAVAVSAPCFSQGTIDPVSAVAEITRRHNIGLHVDCCLGGLLLPFLPKAGYPVPPYDFSVAGVTSISADTHKYGYAPKGSSVVLYHHPDLRRYQYYITTDWTGGIYATPSISGSRAGGLIAATWAAMVHMGEEGYVECARQIMAAAKKIENGVKLIAGLRVLGEPGMSVVAFGTDNSTVGKRLNIYNLSEAMNKREWHLNTLQNPPSIHICCTYLHRNAADRFLQDLAASVEEVLSHPERFKNSSAALYGLNEAVPNNSTVSEIAMAYLDCLFKTRPQ